MAENAMNISSQNQQPQLLQYLSGEISFDAWLDSQRQQNDALPVTEDDLSRETSILMQEQESNDNSSSIFSSWGQAFTSSQKQTSTAIKEEANITDTERNVEDSEDDDDDDDDGEEEMQYEDVLKPEVDPISNLSLEDLKLPDFSELPVYNPEDNQIQGCQLIPFIETLVQLLPTSSIRPKSRRRKQLNDDEVPDIMKDFHNFQLRKRTRKGVPMRSKLPELCRLQMGQANLLVAKGDFKQAADICMEVVREAPTSGIPFKTLSFIYEEQGNKEMSLQYSLISAFLDCKDGQEWIELSKRCLEAGNMKQALACYDRACKFNPDNISLQWERARMYFSLQDYRKALDIYQVITKLLKPKDQFTYIEMAKDMAKLYHQNGLTDKAGEILEAAFRGCPSYKDHEGVNLLSEIYMGSKKYGKVIKLITSTCGVKIPQSKTTIPSIASIENQSLESLNSLINKTLHEDFKDLTSKMASVASTSSMSFDETSASALTDLVQGKSSSEQQYTMLQPVKVSSSPKKQDGLFVPNDLPLDIRIKLAVCMIYRKELTYSEAIIHPLFDENLESVGDLLYDIAEAYFETSCYDEALKYLLELVGTKKYKQAGVWLKIGECYEQTENIEKCIDAYYQVLSLAPLQASVRLTLASALRSVGRNEEAIAVLAEYEEVCVDDEGDEKITISEENRLKVEEYESWYRKCLKMYREGRLREFMFHSYILMYNYLMTGYSKFSQKTSNYLSKVSKIMLEQRPDGRSSSVILLTFNRERHIFLIWFTIAHQKKQTIGKIHFWEFMLKVLKISVQLKEFKKAINLLEQAMLFKPYAESKQYRLELDYLQTTLYYVSGEYSKAFDSFRSLLMHESEAVIQENSLWNLFSRIANRMLDKRHHRFTLRLLFKKPKLIPLMIHNGNNSHLSGTYKYAIGEFSRAFREWPTYPLNSLLLGISFLHLSCQKFHKTRHTSILHGMIFMFQYFNLREENQEAYYNVARAFHQIGLVHIAVHYYNKALEFPLHDEKQLTNSKQVTYHPYIDLHREAAYNLHLIYKASGNYELARKIIYRYCWV